MLVIVYIVNKNKDKKEFIKEFLRWDKDYYGINFLRSLIFYDKNNEKNFIKNIIDLYFNKEFIVIIYNFVIKKYEWKAFGCVFGNDNNLLIVLYLIRNNIDKIIEDIMKFLIKHYVEQIKNL